MYSRIYWDIWSTHTRDGYSTIGVIIYGVKLCSDAEGYGLGNHAIMHGAAACCILPVGSVSLTILYSEQRGTEHIRSTYSVHPNRVSVYGVPM